MKPCTKNLFLLPALMAGLGLMPAGRVTAQTFTTLHNLAGLDEAYPRAGLVLSGNTLYGTTNGRSPGNGTVFAVNTNGTGFTILHTFTATSGPPLANSDGAHPNGGVIVSGNTLYGTAFAGGSSGNGTVFKVNTDGTGFTTLHSFTATPALPSPSINSDGANPLAGLILSGNTLYGTAYRGGSSGNGTVFALNTDGTDFKTLYSFTALVESPLPPPSRPSNSDGANPEAGLILSGNTLYGTAYAGGSSGRGTVFAVNTDGTGFKTLYSFTAIVESLPPPPEVGGYRSINGDGANPLAGLILLGNTLYGTAVTGGSSGQGTVFAVNTDGTGFTTLHSFTARSGSPAYFNSDGALSWANLVSSGNTLYGTATGGGSGGMGTVFAVTTDGSGFTTLYSFTATATTDFRSPNSDGAVPEAGLLLSRNTLYGTAFRGGSSGVGTVFSLSLPPPSLTIVRSGADVLLTWPADAGFALQSTADLESPAAWSPVSPEPSVVNGQNAVTHPISGTPKFFRLSQ